MSENSDSSVTIAALVAAQTLVRPALVNDIPHAILPPGYALSNLERTLPEPARRRGAFDVQDAESFNALVRMVRSQLNELLPLFYARSGTSASVTAVINFETWRDFTVTLRQRLSDPFLEWYNLNARPQAQRAFALFLEERTAHVVKPEGAALLELARKFKANVSVRFQSVVESENGDNSLEFIKTTEAGSSDARSRMKVPDVITLFMPVWHGGEPAKFNARFTYTIGEGGKLSLGFEILNLNELLANELAKVVNSIAKEHNDIVVIEGANTPVTSL